MAIDLRSQLSVGALPDIMPGVSWGRYMGLEPGREGREAALIDEHAEAGFGGLKQGAAAVITFSVGAPAPLRYRPSRASPIRTSTGPRRGV
jgi:hypothetical protein